MLPINEKIFKAYDVRGIYPDEIDEKSAYLLGRAYAYLIRPKKIVVGRDMRVASPKLLKSFVTGANDMGADVESIGEVSVDALYYALFRDKKYDGGVYCTASHNPKEYHGFKMFTQDHAPVRGVDLQKVVFHEPQYAQEKHPKGSFGEIDILDDFISHLLRFIDVKKIRPLTVVIDAGNGMAGKIIPELEKYLPVRVHRLFFELDGNFPNHPSNPLEPQSQKAVCRAVKKIGADFGVIFDGDTDRLFFIDEQGQFIRADITLLILAKYIISKHPGETIIYNAICSKAVPEFVSEWGGKAVRSKVGFVNIKEAMRKHNAILGGEISAHYNFRENFYSDSGFIAFLVLAEHLCESREKLSEMVRELTRYAKSDEINLRVQDIPGKIEAIKDAYKNFQLDFLDGVTVSSKDFWFNVRASNTEPLLRLTAEADTEELLKKKISEVSELLNI